MTVVSVSLPDSLLAQADAFLADRGFAGRSELVRAALRDFLGRESAQEEGADRSATLTLLYPDGYERKIGEIRHEFTDIVRSMLHDHTPDLCVEIFMLKGPSRRIRQFGDALRAARETRLVQTTFTDVPETPPRPSRHGHGHAR